MKVLAVKQPWASLIAEGKKTIEVRSRNTNIRGEIAIYASRSKFDARGMLAPGYTPGSYEGGQIIATAEIVDCKQYIRTHEAAEDMNKHQIRIKDGDELQHMYGWELANIKKLETPIPFKMPRGCVVWANYDGEIP